MNLAALSKRKEEMKVTKISELKLDMNNVEVEGKITELADPKQIRTKFGTQTTLTVATLQDDSGNVKVNLWGNQSDGIETGQTIKISGGFTKAFREELQLSIGKKGSMKVL